jgi:hypothetical protein
MIDDKTLFVHLLVISVFVKYSARTWNTINLTYITQNFNLLFSSLIHCRSYPYILRFLLNNRKTVNMNYV